MPQPGIGFDAGPPNQGYPPYGAASGSSGFPVAGTIISFIN